MPSITLDSPTSKNLIAKLEAENIEFTITGRFPGTENIPISPFPTKFGLGAKITISVAHKDANIFDSICRRVMTPNEGQTDEEREYPPGFLMHVRSRIMGLFGR